MGIGQSGAFWLPPYLFLISLQSWLERLAKLPMGVEGGLKILLAWA
jgi:hypothetical protein